VRKITVPIAPFPEQHRIAAAIDSYFSRLDEAVMLLERVQRNLTRYRAAVLNAAVQGRLVPTEAELARQEGRNYEPASVLLERILAERRRQWEEAELARMKAAGKAPKDGRWKSNYKEPMLPDAGVPRELPKGWCWATLDQLSMMCATGLR
jgi:type I restriction enzyme S subunit